MFLGNIRLYYLLLSYFFVKGLYASPRDFFNKIGELNSDSFWGAYWLNRWLGYPYPLFVLLSFLGIFCGVAAFRNPARQRFRIVLGLVCLLVVMGGGHTVNCFMLPALALACLREESFQGRRGQWEAYRVALCAFLFPYFASGLWKCLEITDDLFSGINPSNNLTLHIYEMYNERQMLSRWVIDHPSASAVLYFGAVLMQMVSMLCLWKPRWIAPMGVAIILFHLGTIQLLAVGFDWNVVASLCLMVSFPFFLKVRKLRPLTTFN